MSSTSKATPTPAPLDQLREKARMLRIHSMRMTTAAGLRATPPPAFPARS